MAIERHQLTVDEYNDRVGAVLEARTRGDIAEHVRDVGQPHSTSSPQRKVRTGFVVAGAGVVVAGLVTAFSIVTFGQGNCFQPNAPGAGCLVVPPASATLTGKDFLLGQTPKADYLGDKKVLTAQGTGSQTTPTFVLDGGVLTAAASQNGAGAYFYAVPVGQRLDVTKTPSWQAPTAAGSGNVVSTIPPSGTYRLYVLAPTGTHWNVKLNEFWLTPSGVTVAPPSAQPNSGQTLVEVRGEGDYKSPGVYPPGRRLVLQCRR